MKIIYICETCGHQYDNTKNIGECRVCKKDVCLDLSLYSCGTVCFLCKELICKKDFVILERNQVCYRCLKGYNVYRCEDCNNYHIEKKMPQCSYCNVELSQCDVIHTCKNCGQDFCNLCLENDLCKNCFMSLIQ